jgi:hypothetical protein
MATYRCEPLAELIGQLRYAPPERRRHQMEQAEALYWQIDPDRAYPPSFIVFRITDYRPEDARIDRTAIAGAAVRHDLAQFVLDLSATLDDTFDDHTPRPLDHAELAATLNVASRTILRYRKQGLFARKLWYPTARGPRQKLGYLQESVERFKQDQARQLDRAAQFDRMDDDTRHAMIVRARRIAGRVGVSPHRVAQHLARKYGRSIEAIRLLLVQHDQHDPRFAIFRDHTAPMSDKQQRVVLRAWQRGVPVRQMVDRYGRSRDALYRAIHQQEARVLHAIDLTFVPSPTFDLDDAEDVILAPTSAPSDDETKPDPAIESLLPPALRRCATRPLPGASQEQAMFVRFNYLKYRVAEIREGLDRYDPRPSALDEAQARLRQMAILQRHLAMTYLSVVAAVVRQHLGERATQAKTVRRHLIVGSAVLLREIGQFDAGRGARFETTLRWALMRQFAQRGRRPVADRTLARLARIALASDQLPDWLEGLAERDRQLIELRFDLPIGPRSRPRTLEAVAVRLGATPWHVAAAERRAFKQLRRAAGAVDHRLDHGLPMKLWPTVQ